MTKFEDVVKKNNGHFVGGKVGVRNKCNLRLGNNCMLPHEQWLMWLSSMLIICRLHYLIPQLVACKHQGAYTLIWSTNSLYAAHWTNILSWNCKFLWQWMQRLESSDMWQHVVGRKVPLFWSNLLPVFPSSTVKKAANSFRMFVHVHQTALCLIPEGSVNILLIPWLVQWLSIYLTVTVADTVFSSLHCHVMLFLEYLAYLLYFKSYSVNHSYSCLVGHVQNEEC